MGFPLKKSSFAGGEISPALYGREDIAKYGVSAKRLINFFSHPQGGTSNRMGTYFVNEAKDSANKVRLFPFRYSNVQTYMLEFGEQYIRVIKDGGYVLEANKTITAATQAASAVLTIAAHGWNIGDWVFIDGVVGMTRLNGRFFKITGTTTNTITINVNSTGFGAYVSGGTIARVYTISSPYDADDLFRIKYTQSKDVLTLSHPSYEERELSRIAHDNWSLTTVATGASIAAPGSPAVSVQGAAGTTTYNYAVTAIKDETFEESTTALATTATGNATLSATNFNRITFTAVAGATKYAVYKQSNGVYGYIGSTETLQFDDKNIAPELDDTPPKVRTPFTGLGNYPAVSGYWTQRKVSGGSANEIDFMQLSQTGIFKNYNVSSPLKSTDALSLQLVAADSVEIRHFVALDGLLVFTSSTEFILLPVDGVVSAVDPPERKIQSYIGASHTRPLVIKNSVLFVQEMGNIIRDFAYDLNSDGYKGNELNILANHLTEGKEVIDWCYQQSPYSLIWAIQDDGTLLSCTYVKEQDVYAWAQHNSEYGDAVFESCATIPEGSEDAVYFVVRRYVNGTWKRYIEKLASRRFTNVRDCFFVDCGVSYDNPINVSGITNANPAVVTTATNHGFLNDDEIDLFDLVGLKNNTDLSIGVDTLALAVNKKRFTVKNKTGTTFQLYDAEAGAYVDLTGVTAYRQGGTARKAVSVITNLDHIEGKQVSILADGSVPDKQIVTNGQITLTDKASRIHIGLPYRGLVETLDVDIGQAVIQGKPKVLSNIYTRTEKTRGLKVGPDENKLVDMPDRQYEYWGEPTEAKTRIQRVNILPKWKTDGTLTYVQDFPLPATILALYPEVTVGA